MQLFMYKYRYPFLLTHEQIFFSFHSSFFFKPLKNERMNE